ncbi:MAG: hypothetical protein ACOYNR_11340 [Blastocatellia bacterium]
MSPTGKLLPDAPPTLAAWLWILVCGLAGALLLWLFVDSCQQDGGLHYLFAKWAWTHPEILVGVWARPLYTTLYAIPALAGYQATRGFSVLICLVIAWQTYQIARDLGLPRPALAIPFVWLQPSFFLFAADNMTEPVFALVYVIALRLHLRGRLVTGMIVASLTILARPEGFFLGLLWAVWIWRAHVPGGGLPQDRAAWRRVSSILWLGTGILLWWLAAWALTGDPLFILHNWPRDWPLTGTIYGAAGLLAYPARLPEIVGPFLLIPFAWGLVRLLRELALPTLTSSFLLLFGLHTILRAFGLLGSAGYPRYLITISPAIALLTLVGWNRLAGLIGEALSRPIRLACASVILATSAYANAAYVDGAEWSRDAYALEEIHRWVAARQRQAPLPITRLVWNEPYVAILFGRDPWENVQWTRHPAHDQEIMRKLPAGTLVVWDQRIGPKWYAIEAADFQNAGFELLHEASFTLRGYLLSYSWFGVGGPRHQRYFVFYKGPVPPSPH